ncbi:CaiB/BaiF CoA transferase family protein [Streptomyces sp. NPDC051677]|uniref:CaiB/BaiF CoA transferase family protein n=1 Tax=Streptomyces sp. NPDC051677 TaxID=3365669 RepID=UPI0037CE918C
MQTTPLSRSLAGVRVLDLTRNLAGPFCTMLLADLGADVIKVETPAGGDDTRSWAPPLWNGHSATFLTANRNKRSIAVDLDEPDGQAIIRDLAARCDVLVESFRPGSLTKRALGYEDLRTVNPSLVYCSVSAYGGTGPMKDRPGYDPVLQAATGIMDMTGYPDGPPARLGIGAIDLGTALWAAIGIQAALANRADTGHGSHVEASLFETATWWMSYHLTGYLGSGVVPRRQGTGTPFIAPYEVFPTADGDLLVSAGNDRSFTALVSELGLPGLASDERFRTNGDRVGHKDELRSLLRPAFLAADAETWEERLAKRGVPCNRVRTVADLADDEQVAALGLLTTVPHPDIPDLRLVDTPLRMDGDRARHRSAPPALGEHTDDVLAELGYEAMTIRQLRDSGVVA